MQDKFEWLMSQCRHLNYTAFTSCLEEQRDAWEASERLPYIAVGLAVPIGLLIGAYAIYRHHTAIVGTVHTYFQTAKTIDVHARTEPPVSEVQASGEVSLPLMRKAG